MGTNEVIYFISRVKVRILPENDCGFRFYLKIKSMYDSH